jgi:hypothetical protein
MDSFASCSKAVCKPTLEINTFISKHEQVSLHRPVLEGHGTGRVAVGGRPHMHCVHTEKPLVRDLWHLAACSLYQRPASKSGAARAFSQNRRGVSLGLGLAESRDAREDGAVKECCQLFLHRWCCAQCIKAVLRGRHAISRAY